MALGPLLPLVRGHLGEGAVPHPQGEEAEHLDHSVAEYNNSKIYLTVKGRQFSR